MVPHEIYERSEDHRTKRSSSVSLRRQKHYGSSDLEAGNRMGYRKNSESEGSFKRTSSIRGGNSQEHIFQGNESGPKGGVMAEATH